MFEEDHFALAPINFYQIAFDCHYLEPNAKKSLLEQKRYLLPDLSALCSEETFAKGFLGWNHEGLEVFVSVNRPFKRCSYPDIDRGDSLELFFDTRDVKTSGYNTRFCHHFFFLPESIEGHHAGEMTRFRGEDIHDLCNPKDLIVNGQIQSNSYSLRIQIPSSCLNGYDPEQFQRMGFTYRINSTSGHPQHFSALTEEFQIEQQPSLWSSATLVS